MLVGCQQEDPHAEAVAALEAKGLQPQVISAEDFFRGVEPEDFAQRAGAPYRPSFNEDPAIPPQCWIETGYGTQNACLYCHTDYLAQQRHGNALFSSEDQILYNFPSPALNRIPWRNILFPEEIDLRLAGEGVALPDPADAGYVRHDNWAPAYARGRASGGENWFNRDAPDVAFALFPALDPNHLFPFDPADPTGGGTHGYVDPGGFVRDEYSDYTGWRAVNFFPYALFTPLTGSVSGIYIRLPRPFRTANGAFSVAVYQENLDLVERNIKARPLSETHYQGDASGIAVRKGFYPVGTEFAHPLHYVDLLADGEAGTGIDGVAAAEGKTYEFPGTRSKRLKEMRYMYKWREVTWAELAEDEEAEDEEEGFESFVGREGQGWLDNGAGWILAAYIEDRSGALRPQTTEELVQCIGCHSDVGNTVDAVWSFHRKLPGDPGWAEMSYGDYRARRPAETRLQDQVNPGVGLGEMQYFYSTVVGADLYGVMTAEVAGALMAFAGEEGRAAAWNLRHPVAELFDNEALKTMGASDRRSRLLERQRVMRAYAAQKAYLFRDAGSGRSYIRGDVFYPSEATMLANIYLYRKIVLDQSYNLGKDVFGTENEHVPFTFRSDGEVLDADRRPIPVGEVIASRPYDEDGVGITPTGLVKVNEDGEPVDIHGNPVDIDEAPEQVVGHYSTGGTFNPLYNPLLDDEVVELD